MIAHYHRSGIVCSLGTRGWNSSWNFQEFNKGGAKDACASTKELTVCMESQEDLWVGQQARQWVA